MNILCVLRVGSALSEMGHKAAKSALCHSLGFFWNRNKSCMNRGMKPQVNTLLVGSFCCLREEPNQPLIMEGNSEELHWFKRWWQKSFLAWGSLVESKAKGQRGACPRKCL